MQTNIHSFDNLVAMLGISERYGPRFPVVNTQDQDLLIQVVVLFVGSLRLNMAQWSNFLILLRDMDWCEKSIIC